MTSAGRIALSDHSTAMRQDGSGSDVILLHGLGLGQSMWDGVVAALGGRFHIVRYDLRWNGHAAGAPPGDLDTMVDDVLDVADQLGLARFHLAGVSMGGAVAMTFAMRFPERLRSLAVACAPSHAFPAFEERASSAENEGMVVQVSATLNRWFAAATIFENGPAVRYARACIQAMATSDWAASWRALAGFVPGQLHPDLRCRLIAGAFDRSTPPEIVGKLIAYMKDARLDIIENGEHMVVLEQPQIFATILADFWDDCERV